MSIFCSLGWTCKRLGAQWQEGCRAVTVPCTPIPTIHSQTKQPKGRHQALFPSPHTPAYWDKSLLPQCDLTLLGECSVRWEQPNSFTPWTTAGAGARAWLLAQLQCPK